MKIMSMCNTQQTRETIMFHGHLDYLQKPSFGGRHDTKLEDHGILNARNRWVILLYYVWGLAWIKIHWINIGLRGQSHMALHCPWPHYMILEVPWDGLWTLSFGLSQFHGHGSWLMCEVALNAITNQSHAMQSRLTQESSILTSRKFL
jgi:hypothetical protein